MDARIVVAGSNGTPVSDDRLRGAATGSERRRGGSDGLSRGGTSCPRSAYASDTTGRTILTACGGACAQMVLDLVRRLYSQKTLMQEIQKKNSTKTAAIPWKSDPDGLRKTLNARRGRSGGPFRTRKFKSKRQFSQDVVWTILSDEVPPIVLTSDTSHWVVVDGYDVDREPVRPSDKQYKIRSFFLRDPWEISPTAPPPPHSRRDRCGEGQGFGTEEEHCTYEEWKRDLRRVKKKEGKWGGWFVAVSDPKPVRRGPRRRIVTPAKDPTARDPKAQDPRTRASKKPRRSPIAPRIVPDRDAHGPRSAARGHMTDARAKQIALQGVEAHGLNALEGWKEALLHSSPAKPIPVRRLDRSHSWYFIVPWRSANGRSRMAVIVDSRHGYRRAVRSSPGGDLLPGVLEPQTMLKQLAGRTVDLGSGGGTLVLAPGSATILPHMVWKPCQESLSPFVALLFAPSREPHDLCACRRQDIHQTPAGLDRAAATRSAGTNRTTRCAPSPARNSARWCR